MKKNTSHALVRIIVIAAMLVLVVAAAIQCANGKSLAETAWSLLPPVIAIVLALVSKEAYSSLFIGVVVGALFTTNFHPVATLDTVVNTGLISAIADNAGSAHGAPGLCRSPRCMPERRSPPSRQECGSESPRSAPRRDNSSGFP